MAAIQINVKNEAIKVLEKRINACEDAMKIYPAIDINLAKYVTTHFGENMYNRFILLEIIKKSNEQINELRELEDGKHI